LDCLGGSEGLSPLKKEGPVSNLYTPGLPVSVSVSVLEEEGTGTVYPCAHPPGA